MKLSCEIAGDLLPLYVDQACSKQSAEALEAHLEKCEACRKRLEQMQALEKTEEKDMNLAKGLKKIRKKMKRRISLSILCAAAAALACVFGCEALFRMPLKNVPLQDVQVSAQVYSAEELRLQGSIVTTDDTVEISMGEGDDSNTYSVQIPDIPNAEISMSETALNNAQSISVISLKSPYLLRDIRWKEGAEEGTMYITAIKTSIFNNEAHTTDGVNKMLEFRQIDRIVFVDGGRETLLWEAE